MAYCPNCGVQLHRDAAHCDKCRASFEAKDGWKPSEGPIVQTKNASWTYVIGRLLVWGGHFFLMGVPILFIVYHVLFYKGGGTSGIPLAFSIMFSPVLYVPGYILAAIGKNREAD